MCLNYKVLRFKKRAPKPIFSEEPKYSKMHHHHMSAIFGERLTFSQEQGPDVSLIVYGDEFYSNYETEDGYSVVYDREAGRFCYAGLRDGAFYSSGISIENSPPPEIEKHLQESGAVRLEKAAERTGRARR